MIVEIMGAEQIILEEIADKSVKQNSVAVTYAFCISSSEDINFGKINRAIQERWSRSAVIYIKNKAWKMVERRK